MLTRLVPGFKMTWLAAYATGAQQGDEQAGGVGGVAAFFVQGVLGALDGPCAGGVFDGVAHPVVDGHGVVAQLQCFGTDGGGELGFAGLGEVGVRWGLVGLWGCYSLINPLLPMTNEAALAHGRLSTQRQSCTARRHCSPSCESCPAERSSHPVSGARSYRPTPCQSHPT